MNTEDDTHHEDLQGPPASDVKLKAQARPKTPSKYCVADHYRTNLSARQLQVTLNYLKSILVDELYDSRRFYWTTDYKYWITTTKDHQFPCRYSFSFMSFV